MKPHPRSLSKYLTLCIALVAVCGTGCSGCRKKHPTEASTLSELPPNSLGAVYVNVARLRANPAVQRIRTLLTSSPQASAALTQVRSDCGFDPIDRLDTLLIGMTSAQPIGEDPVFIAHASASAAEIQHCLTTAVPHMSHHTILPAGNVAGHAVFTEQPDPTMAALGGNTDRPQYAVLEHGLVIAKPASMSNDLSAIDHPSPTGNPQLQQAATTAGSDSVFLVLADLLAIKTAIPPQNQPDFSGAAGIPGASGEVMQGLWRSAQNAAFTGQMTPTGVHIGFLVRFAQPADAHLASSLLTTAWAIAKAQLARVAAQPQVMLQGLDPATVNAAMQSMTVANTLANRLVIRDDTTLLRIELDATQQEIDTLTNGVEAGFRAYMNRVNAIQTAPVMPGVPGVQPTL